MQPEPSYRNITTTDVKARLERGEAVRLLDVREPEEYAIARIEGSELLPLSQAPRWINALPRDQELIFFCHHGWRSQQIAVYLAEQLGFTLVSNMLGGIEDWSLRVDPSVPRY